jgi:predicted metalloprotease with PDZ domain
MSRPHTHLFEVEARFPATQGDLTVALPVWTPGSYLVREFARHIQDFSAHDVSGTPLPFERIDKAAFKIRGAGRPVTVRYRVYAHEITVRTSHLDGTHGFFNGANVLVYAEPFRSLPHHLAVDPPAGWTAFTALEPGADGFIARDYDEIVDSPVEVGPHTPLTFTVRGVPHRVVIWGEVLVDRARIAADFAKVCEAEASLFGGLPMKHYLFIVHLADKGRGGLEHAASTTLLYPRFALTTPKGWEDFLTLASHEYFHLWNVKRVKPKALVPFDYSREAYTTLLWAFEGLTAYYDNLLALRAGVMSPARYLTRIGESLSALQSTPGRQVQSLLDASWSAWIKHYRPDENSPNSAVSYYLKGEIVGCLLDLELRRVSGDTTSLDDVMRLLFARYGDGRGVPEDGVEAAVSEVAGTSFSAFLDRALRSTEELDYRVFSHVGLEARARVRESAGDKGGTPPRAKAGENRPHGWVGVVPKGGGAIGAVLAGSPAMEAGLYADDEVVALDGFKADCGTLTTRCDEKRPGETVRVSVFRRDRLLEIPVVLGAKPADALYLTRVAEASNAQRAAYRAWLGAAWDQPEPGPLAS